MKYLDKTQISDNKFEELCTGCNFNHTTSANRKFGIPPKTYTQQDFILKTNKTGQIIGLQINWKQI